MNCLTVVGSPLEFAISNCAGRRCCVPESCQCHQLCNGSIDTFKHDCGGSIAAPSNSDLLDSSKSGRHSNISPSSRPKTCTSDGGSRTDHFSLLKISFGSGPDDDHASGGGPHMSRGGGMSAEFQLGGYQSICGTFADIVLFLICQIGF
jgi:hypothetical protein